MRSHLVNKHADFLGLPLDLQIYFLMSRLHPHHVDDFVHHVVQLANLILRTKLVLVQQTPIQVAFDLVFEQQRCVDHQLCYLVVVVVLKLVLQLFGHKHNALDGREHLMADARLDHGKHLVPTLQLHVLPNRCDVSQNKHFALLVVEDHVSHVRRPNLAVLLPSRVAAFFDSNKRDLTLIEQVSHRATKVLLVISLGRFVMGALVKLFAFHSEEFLAQVLNAQLSLSDFVDKLNHRLFIRLVRHDNDLVLTRHEVAAHLRLLSADHVALDHLDDHGLLSHVVV